MSPKPIDLGCDVSNMLNNVDPENAGDKIDTYCIESSLLNLSDVDEKQSFIYVRGKYNNRA